MAEEIVRHKVVRPEVGGPGSADWVRLSDSFFVDVSEVRDLVKSDRCMGQAIGFVGLILKKCW
jgi:hypothetical protein